MVIDPERPTTSNPSSYFHSPEKKQWPWLRLILFSAAVIGAAIYFISIESSSPVCQLEFKITSDVPFKEDVPRTAHLIIVDQNGSVETIEDNRFASAFIDRRNSFRFTVRSTSISRILFSPAPPDHLVEINGVRALSSSGRNLVEIPLDQVVPNRQVEIVERTHDTLSLKTLPGNEVPMLELTAGPTLMAVADKSSFLSRIPTAFELIGIGSALLLLLVVLSRMFLDVSRRISPFWVAQFGAATALVLTMAVITKFNAHPDEYLQFEASKYFVTHWFPPPLDAPEIEPSFSHYGVSYLQDFDTAYIFIGKISSLFALWTNAELAARLSNVFLFATMAAWLLCRLPNSLAPALCLISPQIWYIFSYVNTDAWALLLAFVVVVQLADNASLLNRSLATGHWRKKLLGPLSFALLMAILLLAKRNYYLFMPFIGLVAFWQVFVWKRGINQLELTKKWLVILVATLAFYLPLRIGHEAINRFDRAHIQAEQAEKFAAPYFKPSEIAAGKGAQRLGLRNRGVTYWELLGTYDWAGQSFQSFCGVYQWMSLIGPTEYYFTVGILYLGLLALLAERICKISWRDALFAASVLALSIGVVLVSAYLSWTADFQPQGRYLFPIIPMLAFLLHHYRESLRSRVFNMLLGGLFACSVYSFVFVGLKNIPK